MPLVLSIRKCLQPIVNFLVKINRSDIKSGDNREFQFYLILGGRSGSGALPWSRDHWIQNIEPLIDEILKKTPEYKSLGFHVSESTENPHMKDNFQDRKLGRLFWDRKSHLKWTIENNQNVTFEELQIWAPNKTKCDKLGIAPDVYIRINNETSHLKNVEHIKFDFSIVIALAADLKMDCNKIIVELSEKLGAQKTVVQNRLWSAGKRDKNKNWTFSNWIMDTTCSGIYRGQSLHTFELKNLEFEPYWTTVYQDIK